MKHRIQSYLLAGLLALPSALFGQACGDGSSADTTDGSEPIITGEEGDARDESTDDVDEEGAESDVAALTIPPFMYLSVDGGR